MCSSGFNRIQFKGGYRSHARIQKVLFEGFNSDKLMVVERIQISIKVGHYRSAFRWWTDDGPNPGGDTLIFSYIRRLGSFLRGLKF